MVQKLKFKVTVFTKFIDRVNLFISSTKIEEGFKKGLQNLKVKTIWG